MVYFNIKRILDLFTAVVLMIFLLPLIIIIIILAWVILKEWPIFIQSRLGKDQVRFTLFKIKTIRTNHSFSDFPNRFLRFLRSTGLDELPQLINVINGNMSMIGPRPLPIEYLSLIKKEHLPRFIVKPGITGLVQVSGGNKLPWQDRFDLDVEYVNNNNLLSDYQIILKTIQVVFSGKKTEGFEKLTRKY
jgi:undecaprenyl phosphate N,N'-diacetylbacillosamine 1-phosphate transferase